MGVRAKVSELKVVGRELCHVPLALQRVYGCSNESGENGEGEKESSVSGGGERVEITRYLLCRRIGFVWRVGGGTEGEGGAFLCGWRAIGTNVRVQILGYFE